jgi:O-antigen/teichoic acid export membrane protein
MLQTSAYAGMRTARYALFQSLTAGLFKIPLPLLLLTLGMSGIFFSWGLSSLLALITSLFLLLPRILPGYLPLPLIKKNAVSQMIRFSTGNYIADIFDTLPGLLFPLIIVNTLNEELNAYFFIAWTIASLLFMVPVSVNSSLLAEAAYEPYKLRILTIRAVIFTLVLLIPAILVIWLIGSKILLVFGRVYSEGSIQLLKILSVSSLPYALVRIYVTINRVRLKIQPVIATYFSIAIITLVGGYLLIPKTGIQGIGIAWICAQGSLAIITSLLLIKRERRLK